MAAIKAKRPRATSDRALWVGAQAHYEDAAYYDKTYARRLDDVRFYEALAATTEGPILEYGVGNGRIALPMARAGADVTGVDWSAPMLADLRAKLAAEPREVQRRLRLVEGDMREVKLRRRFPLVLCTFNTFLHLYTRQDVEAFLGRVRAHLAPGGRFVFDVAVPQPGDLDRDPNRAYQAPRLRHPTTGQLVRYAERFDYDAARQILFVTVEFTPLDGGEPWSVPLAHRQFFPQELEALLHHAGFEVDRVAADFGPGPLDRFSDVAVWTTHLAR
ncbi:MAG: class I SAM-dependent methyltransferase [Myxococcales bacterium]|nr:MAG: class I SAM-dependent methyltransferase [Myxococcales bacterium]